MFRPGPDIAPCAQSRWGSHAATFATSKVDLNLGIAVRLPTALNDQPLAGVGEKRKDDTAIQLNDRPLQSEFGRAQIIALYGHGRSLAQNFIVPIAYADNVITEIHHWITQEIPE